MTVLAVVSEAGEAPPIIRWGARLARALGTELVVLHPGRAVQPQPAVDVDAAAAGEHPVLRAVHDAVEEVWTTFVLRAEQGPAPAISVRRTAHPDVTAGVMDEVEALAPRLVVLPSWEGAAGQGEEHLTHRLLARITCDTVVLRAATNSGGACRRILVPTAGGPHAEEALRLAERMAEGSDGVVTALYVETDAGDEDDPREVGMRQLRRALTEAGVAPGLRVHPRVTLADRPVAGIAAAAPEHDLLFVGASDRGFAQRLLFGTVPDRLLAGSEGMAVAVLRRGRGVGLRPWEALRAWVGRKIPQLSRDDRLSVFETIQTGSRWSADFVTLMALSTAVASLGLLQSSIATVIGAMLIAPLMTPIIGAGLGLVQGNLLIMRQATWSILLGVAIALSTGLLFGLAHPSSTPPPEVFSLGAPTLLDLLVALFSGAAAAYALARPGLSGALAGVAIAVSLEPPLTAAGISFAKGAWKNAQGAALLFGTNLVAIVLGAAATFYLLGLRGSREHSRRHLWAQRVIVGMMIFAAALAFPLGSMLLARLAQAGGPTTVRVTEELRHRLDERLSREWSEQTLVSVQRVGKAGHDLQVVVAVRGQATADLAGRLAHAARDVLPEDVHVEVVCLECAWARSSE